MLIQLRTNGALWVHAEHVKVIRVKNNTNVVMVTMKDGRRYRIWPELHTMLNARPNAVMAARRSIDDDGHFSALLGDMHPLSKQAVIAFVDENMVPRAAAMGAGSLSHTGVAHTDCRSPEGVATGLIDGIIAMSRVLRGMSQTNPSVVEALHDLRGDEDLAALLDLRPPASGAGDLITDPKAKGYRPPGCDQGIEGSTCCDNGCAANRELAEMARDRATANGAGDL